MAYVKTDLQAIGGQPGNSPTHWSYTSADTIATINTVGYFNDASLVLEVNELMFIASSTGGTPVSTINIVNANAAGVVDITDGLVITATDTD